MARNLERPTDLPDFATPPLREVAVGVQFEPLQELRQAHLGDYWQRVKDEYPKVEDRPLIDPVIEEEGSARRRAFKVEFGPPPPNRCWYVAGGGEHLIQVQYDRYVLNWRRGSGNYGHFEPILGEFEVRYKAFVEWAESAGLGEIRPQQIEVNYVNRWAAETLSSGLSVVIDPESEIGLPPPTGERWQARYPLQDKDEVGALYLEASRDNDNVSFKLTVRHRTTSFEWSHLQEKMLSARSLIVQTFTAVTTPDMHDEWGRTN